MWSAGGIFVTDAEEEEIFGLLGLLRRCTDVKKAVYTIVYTAFYLATALSLSY